MISTNDTFSQIEEMALGWNVAGSRVVLLVACEYPHVYRAADDNVVLEEGDDVVAGEVVPGWRYVESELIGQRRLPRVRLQSDIVDAELANGTEQPDT